MQHSALCGGRPRVGVTVGQLSRIPSLALSCSAFRSQSCLGMAAHLHGSLKVQGRCARGQLSPICWPVAAPPLSLRGLWVPNSHPSCHSCSLFLGWLRGGL